MKRFHVFPVFLIFSVLFACQIPTAIEVRGTPELRFSAKMDIVNLFTEELKKSFESSEFKLLQCVNTNNFTYLAYRELYNEQLDATDLPEDFKYVIPGTALDGPKNLINPDPGDSKNIPFSGLEFILDGFSFYNAKSFVFISGSDLIKKLKLEVSVNDVIETENVFDIDKGTVSNCDTNEYFKSTPPSGGHQIVMPLDGSDVKINYRVYAETGKVFNTEDFKNAYVRVELVIWLPLEFKAESDGAEVTFPATFLGDEGKDLFGRSPDDESAVMDIIESLSIIIKLNTNPFIGKNLIIKNKDRENIEIRELIRTNSLNMVFDEETMALINDPDNVPFAPVFKIAFNKDDTLRFPRVFNAIEIIFSARIKYMIDLKKSSGELGETGESG
jgi:hypothetical protein